MKTWTIGELTATERKIAERVARKVTRSRNMREWLLDVIDGYEAISGSTLNSKMKRKLRYTNGVSAQYLDALREAGIAVREATAAELAEIGRRSNPRACLRRCSMIDECSRLRREREKLRQQHLAAWTSLEEQSKFLEEGSFLYDAEAHYDLLNETARLKRLLDSWEGDQP